jgi:hypothetical protein
MSGPAPDPDALRRDRKDDAAGWTSLPSEGFTGVTPEYPLPDPSVWEMNFWRLVWRKPQAAQWSRLGLEPQVAAYVRAFMESTDLEAPAGLKTAVLRMEDGLGISVKGMMTLRWKFAVDEVSARRSKPVVQKLSASERMKARNAEVG